MGIEERKQREKKMLEEMRVKQIHDAAKEVFIRKGFYSATIEDIAKKAELSPATIYLYFKNKDELYASLNLITLQYLHDQVESVYSNDSLSVEEKIKGFKDALYKTYQYRPLILKLILHVQLDDVLRFDAKLSSDLPDPVTGLHGVLCHLSGCGCCLGGGCDRCARCLRGFGSSGCFRRRCFASLCSLCENGRAHSIHCGLSIINLL